MNASRPPARFAFLSCVMLGVGGGAASCSGATASTPAASAESPETRAPVAQSAHGPIRLVGEALGDVPLTAPERAEVEKLASEAEARQAVVRAARRDLTLALAAEVEAGAVNRASIQPRIDAIVAAEQSTQPADRAAFERLHALLGPDQRTAFANALDARVHDRERGAESTRLDGVSRPGAPTRLMSRRCRWET